MVQAEIWNGETEEIRTQNFSEKEVTSAIFDEGSCVTYGSGGVKKYPVTYQTMQTVRRRADYKKQAVE